MASINDKSERGARILASAKEILASLGKSESTTIGVDDTSDIIRIFSQTLYNGDGVIIPEGADKEETRKVLEDIIKCCGGQKDRSGKDGVDSAAVDRFFQALQDYSEWRSKAESGVPGMLAALEPGEPAAAAFAAFQAMRTKIQDYFSRCRLASFDPRAAGPMNRPETDLVNLANKDLSVLGDDVAALPLARIEASRPLSLTDGLNPAWSDRMDVFIRCVVVPLLGEGKMSLTEQEWRQISEQLAPYEAWIAAKSGSLVESLGIDRVRNILLGNARDEIAKVFEKEREAIPRMEAIEDVDQLVRYYRDLRTLLNNFVSFTDFYSPEKWAIFQAGTLYLDGRSCKLCIRVDDIAKHSAVAALGKMYIAYCECTRKDTPSKINIAAAFTAGDSDFLMAGRNGLFIDRQGRDWDAAIVRVIENPISIRQAFWSPYKRIGRMIGEQVEKLASTREKAVQDKTAAGLQDTVKTAEKAGAAPAPTAGAAPAAGSSPAPFDIGKVVGIFAAIGLAVGAIGTALAAIVAAFLSLAWWKQPLAFLAIMLLISGPSMVIAWLKLRQRSLGPLLDAAGWAINGRVKINLLLGRALTSIASLPPNSIRNLADPFEPPANQRRRNLLLTILALVAIAAVVFYWKVL